MSNLLTLLKGASRSKTVITNTLVVVAGTLAYLSDHSVIAAHPEVVGGLVATLGVINVILRFLTVEPVSRKGNKQ